MNGSFYGSICGAKKDVNKAVKVIAKMSEKNKDFKFIWDLITTEAETTDVKEVLEYIKEEYYDEGEIEYEIEFEGEIENTDFSKVMDKLCTGNPEVDLSFSFTNSEDESESLCFNKDFGAETWKQEMVKGEF